MFGGMGMDMNMGFGSSMFGGLHSTMGSDRGGGSGFVMSSSSSSFGGGGGGYSESISSSTVIRNGQRVTRTTRTVRHADGRVETSTTEDSGEAAGGILGNERGGRGGHSLRLGQW